MMIVSRVRRIGLLTSKAAPVGGRSAGSAPAPQLFFLSSIDVNDVFKNNNNNNTKPSKTIRFHSTISSDSGESKSCPHTSSFSTEEDPTTTTTTTTTTLRHVRSFPLVGSLIPPLSGIPDTMRKNSLLFWQEMRRQYGDFFTFGFPPIGSRENSHGTMHIISDPREMVPVIKAGGAYPGGFIESFWPRIKYNESRQSASLPMFGRGEEWKRLRTFMQKDLLHPESARGYVPGMILAGQLASKGANASRNDLNMYMRRCSFDFFAISIFGELTQVSDPTTPTEPDNELFITRTCGGLATAIQMLVDPYERVMNVGLGLTTTKMKKCFEQFDECTEIGMRKIENFTERKAAGKLTVNEENSYLSRALDRQKEPESNVTVKEAQALAFSGLFAAVDTTASVMGWNLFHVARCPDVQEKLYQELKQSVDRFGQDGKLTVEALSKSNVPYLHAVIRESHRLTPAGPMVHKEVMSDNVTVFHKKMKKGDVVGLNTHSITMDPDYVEDPQQFIPERWLQDAVEARKNTPKEIVDHPYLKEPFSQGGRKCPGSRVAINEIQVLLAQLVLDWKITSPVSRLEDITFSQKSALEVDLPQLAFEARN